MKGLGDMLKQVQTMQQKMQEVEERLNELEVEATAGGGMVKMTANGHGGVTKINIDPELLKPEDHEILEDLLIAAFQDLQEKTKQAAQDEQQNLLSGIGLPAGFKMPF